MVNTIFQYGKGEQKHITKKVIKFPNQSTLLTLIDRLKTWRSVTRTICDLSSQDAQTICQPKGLREQYQPNPTKIQKLKYSCDNQKEAKLVDTVSSSIYLGVGKSTMICYNFCCLYFNFST